MARRYERGTVAERFAAKVQPGAPDECWPWTYGTTKAGYGQVSRCYTHRIAYELVHGPIPPGLTIDHTCHNDDVGCPGGDGCPHRRCVNPAHLEAVTIQVNVARSPNAGQHKTHCPQGHPYDEANTYRPARGGRMCRECMREYDRRRRPGRVYDPEKRRAAYERWKARR